MRPAPELVDALLSSRVLVYGSPPPGGRDLDLLTREPERRSIQAGLSGAGFSRAGDEWVRFAACTVEIVELTSVASWDLSGEELDALFAEALHIDGLENLVRPSPHHNLLILARRLIGDGQLSMKLRRRVEQALGEDPDAWTRARARAGAWNATTALGALEEAWRRGAPVPRTLRRAARRERRRVRVKARPTGRALLSGARTGPRPRRGVVVAFSGLDGAGKSSQAAALADTLERLGYRALVARTRITWDDPLWTIAEPIRRVLRPPLRALTALRPHESPHVDAGESAPIQGASSKRETLDPVTRVRQASPLLTDLWTVVITLANASVQWKLMRHELVRGGIVICDRYTLDSIVELRYRYGSERPLRRARTVLSWLYPTPARAYFLDVSPETALERKGEWGIDWLSVHRELYLQECERMGVRVLDGAAPLPEICAEVAREVWQCRLPRRGRWPSRSARPSSA